VGDRADLIEVDSLDAFNVQRTWIEGELVAERGTTRLPPTAPTAVNKFVPQVIHPQALHVKATGTQLQVIEAIDGQLVTGRLQVQPKIVDDLVESDTTRDILKLVVVNRYAPAAPAVAFISGMGLARGAMASSVAHDSHNVIAVGVADDDVAAAVNLVMESGGGLAVASRAEQISEVLPLPIAGLMATGSCQEVGAAYQKLDAQVKQLGSGLRAPFMTLSFMALLVIPALKLSDLGLFDGAKFEFTPVLE
jgi:adenine deaminase